MTATRALMNRSWRQVAIDSTLVCSKSKPPSYNYLVGLNIELLQLTNLFSKYCANEVEILTMAVMFDCCAS
jgi:hypothetical protein